MKYLGRYISRLLGRSLSFALSGLLPSCIRDNAVAWWRDFNNIRTSSTSTTYNNILDVTWDRTGYVSFATPPDVTGSTTISFSLYGDSTYSDQSIFHFIFKNGDTDYISCYMTVGQTNGSINLQTSNSGFQYGVNGNSEGLTSEILQDTLLEFVINKNASGITSVTVNGTDINVLVTTDPSNARDNQNNIYAIVSGGTPYSDFGSYILNFNINDAHIWPGYSSVDLATSWEDTVGSIDGTINGNAGPLLTTNVTDGDTVTGVLDIANNYEGVFLLENPEIAGNKKVNFTLYLDNETGYSSDGILCFANPDNNLDILKITVQSDELVFYHTNTVDTSNKNLSITGLSGQFLDFEVTKTSSDITDVTINSVSQTLGLEGTGNAAPNRSSIYHYNPSSNSNTGGEDLYVWDISIYDDPSGSNTLIHSWSGQPNGNTKTVWEDSVGNADGVFMGMYDNTSLTIGGTSIPYVEEEVGSRVDTIYYGQFLDATSGQINLYRSSGTYDYTDPTTGTRSEDNAIPGTGLITVPANGICDIGINRDGTFDGTNYSIYENFYPICEGAGDVLHDVLEDSKHISVDTAVWAEELYGSDYLNQEGFLNKTESDALGHAWETLVNGTNTTLNDNTLIPVAQWNYENLQDNTRENILGNTGEQIQVKVNT